MKQPKMSNLKIDVKGTKAIRKLQKKDSKIKITINLDAEILEDLRHRAEKTGVPYQRLLNTLLKESLEGQDEESSRLDKLEKEVANLKKKLSA